MIDLQQSDSDDDAGLALVAPDDPAATHVLVAEDDPMMQQFMQVVLEGLGYRVTVVADGRAALALLEREPINLVITDFMMPHVDGAEFCRRVRARRGGRYTYIILLTGRQDSEALIEGMEAGADDFLNKPPDVHELHVRLEAGERVLRLERQLERRNRKLIAANERLRQAYRLIERDLEAAALAQRRLLPPPRDLGGLRFDWLFVPSSHVGGDTHNVLPRVAGRTAFFQIDVSGHGVPAALLSVTLQRLLAADSLDLGGDAAAAGRALWDDPCRLLAELNRRFQTTDDDSTYFTMVYGVVDHATGEVVLTQAGHPSPLLVSPEGAVQVIGTGGLPVGLLPDIACEELRFRLEPGARLLLHSDGVVECTDPLGVLFGEERLMAFAAETASLKLERALGDLAERLKTWRGGSGYDDDVSVLVLEKS